MNRRSLRGSLRPLPGAVSTPVETSTPQGRTCEIASATLSGVSPPARRRRTSSSAPSTCTQSNTRPEPGFGASTSTTSAGPADALANPRPLTGRLATGQLRGLEPDLVQDLGDPLGALVTKDADRQDLVVR